MQHQHPTVEIIMNKKTRMKIKTLKTQKSFTQETEKHMLARSIYQTIEDRIKLSINTKYYYAITVHYICQIRCINHNRSLY